MDNICVVLVEPLGPLNIGSVCRAMLNFGVTDLRLINPQTNHLVHEARQMAVKATGVLEDARLYSSLSEALAGCSLCVGTTRRFGQYREDMLHPDEAAELLLPIIDDERVALVFGREDKGLHTSELDLCQRFVTIPTNDQLPSMNLAHSVGICLYELYKARGSINSQGHGRKNLATNEHLESMYKHMESTLLKIGFLNQQNPDHIMRTFRRVLGRAGLNDREVQIMRGMCRRIDILDQMKRDLEVEGTSND